MSESTNVEGDPLDEFVFASEGNGRIERTCRKNALPPANFIEGGKKRRRHRSKQKKSISEDVDPIRKKVLIGDGNHGINEEETDCLIIEDKQESGKLVASGNEEVLILVPPIETNVNVEICNTDKVDEMTGCEHEIVKDGVRDDLDSDMKSIGNVKKILKSLEHQTQSNSVTSGAERMSQGEVKEN